MTPYLPADQVLLILGMGLVTYIPRAAPLLFLSSRELNPRFIRWLEMVPPAVLAALLAPELLLQPDMQGGKDLFLSADNLFLLAVPPTFLAGWLTKNFFCAVIAGMGAVALLRLFL
jgi:branched-subunit amino acid transport protein